MKQVGVKQVGVKVGIYNEPSSGSIGGCESSIAVLAEAMAGLHQVEIVHHRPSLTSDQLAEVSGANLTGVSLRYYPPEPLRWSDSHNPFARYSEAQSWHAGLSSPYDLFIAFTHSFPPFCHAPRGILLVLFPLHERPAIQLQKGGSATAVWRGLKRFYHDWEWQKRFESYQVKLANSRFTQDWTRRRWAIESRVIYPPVDTRFPASEKSPVILSVGRFSTEGHSKKQLEMMEVYRDLERDSLSGWEYYCVGGLSDCEKDRAYYDDVRCRAPERGANVLANIERGRLRELYEQAAIFWHAAGYGEDDSDRPELSEHFGITTVEAMAAGCVPVVIDKGGQSEIIRHGVNGFVWRSLEELKQYTEMIARDCDLQRRMREAARARAGDFSRAHFIESFMRYI